MTNSGEPADAGARARAYSYLNRRERTVSEMRSYLERISVPPAEIEAVIAELVGDGYLDDVRYARVFAQDKRELESWGSERIARTLATRGVDRDLIAATVGGDPAQTERERAIEVLQRRFREPPTSERDRERALGILVRKGYESDVAYEAVRRWGHGGSPGWAD
jgi:regulatory protein